MPGVGAGVPHTIQKKGRPVETHLPNALYLSPHQPYHGGLFSPFTGEKLGLAGSSDMPKAPKLGGGRNLPPPAPGWRGKQVQGNGKGADPMEAAAIAPTRLSQLSRHTDFGPC